MMLRVFAIEARAVPDFVPTVLRDEFLHGHVEVVCVLEGILNVLITKDFTARFQALFERFVVHSGSPEVFLTIAGGSLNHAADHFARRASGHSPATAPPWRSR